MDRIPSLDGFRAISILLILFCHSRYAAGFPRALADIARHGAVGVNIFFVISGFLITTLLVKERERYGTINFRSFYLRRALRILPVFLLYTTFIILWKQYETLSLTSENLLHVLTFTVNFDPHNSWFLGHYWSLSVEEQFYLVWPLMLAFGSKYLKPITVVLILYSCAARVIDYKLPGYRNITLTPFFIYSDAILIGALSALIYKERPSLLDRKVFKLPLIQGIAVLLIITFIYLSGYGKLAIISLPFSGTVIGVCTMYLLFCYIKPSDTVLYKLLNTKLLTHIGVLSYSIYIWQQFFFVGQQHLWRLFPVDLVVIYVVSLLSYHLWEKPFLKLKQRRSLIPVQPSNVNAQ